MMSGPFRDPFTQKGKPDYGGTPSRGISGRHSVTPPPLWLRSVFAVVRTLQSVLALAALQLASMYPPRHSMCMIDVIPGFIPPLVLMEDNDDDLERHDQH